MRPNTTTPPADDSPPPGGNPKGLLVGLGLMLTVLALYGLGRPGESDDTTPPREPIAATPPASPQAARETPPPVEQKPRPPRLLGLAIPSKEQAEQQRREVEAAERADLVKRAEWIAADFASHSLGNRFIGEAVDGDSGQRAKITATIVAKTGAVADNSATLILKAESNDPRHVAMLAAGYPEPVRSGGSKRRYTQNRQSNLQPELRFVRVTAAGVPKRKGPPFFTAATFRIGFDADGALAGKASDRYGRSGGTTFTLRPADAIAGDGVARQWEAALTPGTVWRGRCEQFKRMAWNEKPLSCQITVAVAGGKEEDERLLVVSRDRELVRDRSVVRLARGDLRTIGGWHWVGERQAPSLVVEGRYGGVNYLVDRDEDSGVPVAARLTDSGKLALRFGPNGSAILSRDGAIASESTDRVAARVREALVEGASFRGTITVPPEHWPGRRNEAKAVAIPARLSVARASTNEWTLRLAASGPSSHTAEYRAELMEDRFERVRFPLRLTRTSLSGGGDGSRRDVCLLAQNASESPIAWLRVVEEDGVVQLVGKTPRPNNETLAFKKAGRPSARPSTQVASGSASDDEVRSRRMLNATQAYLKSSKPGVVAKGRQRLADLIEKFPESEAAAEARVLLAARVSE